MSNIEDLKIIAYLSPHPLGEDTYIEEEWISWLPGYSKEQTEDETESYLSETNIALYEKIENFTADLFKKAIERMWPLLKDYYFQKICISIDYANYKSSSSLAGYEYKNSNPGKGKYYFSLDQVLLQKYSAFINQKIESLPETNIWEHELIHMIDHWEILKASFLVNSDLPLNNLHYYALKYREEGIANLMDLLDGKIKGINSIDRAKEVFAANYARVKAELANYERTDEKIRSEIFSGYDFYEVGPWIMLDLLDEIFSLSDKICVKDLERKISNGESLSEELKLEIIREAFHFDTNFFLSRLGKYCNEK